MEVHSEKILTILQYHFDLGMNVQQACDEINGVYGKDTIPEQIAEKWYARFRSGNFDIEYEPAIGQACVENGDEESTKILIEKQ